MRKKALNYIIDTSVLVQHPQVLSELQNSTIYIPLEVLEELDGLKVKSDSVGQSARFINKFIDRLRGFGSLASGVEFEGNTYVIFTEADLSLLPSGAKENNDNRIIACAIAIAKKKKNLEVLTKDIAFRVKCDALGLKASDYPLAIVADEESYKGYRTLAVTKEDLDSFYKDGFLATEEEMFPNECFVMKAEKASALGYFNPRKKGQISALKHASAKDFTLEGFKPRNMEQVFAADLLLNRDINLLTLTGFAGTGKSFLSIAAAMKGFHEHTFKKIVLSRPTHSTSKEIGFLPGTKLEKMQPWVQPFFDNLEVIYDNRQSYIQMMLEKGQIEVESLAYIRGRTLAKTIFIVDEAQNITHSEAKAIITRMGEGSKLVLIGDLEQIDSRDINQLTSGLNSAVELFKPFHGAAHITMTKGERSELATFASKVM